MASPTIYLTLNFLCYLDRMGDMLMQPSKLDRYHQTCHLAGQDAFIFNSPKSIRLRVSLETPHET